MSFSLPNFSIDLSGRVALVTGASSGLGRRFAETLASAGAAVAVAGRRLERLQELAAEIEGRGGRAIPVQLDIRDVHAIGAAINKVESAFGTVDILVNNAGIADANLAIRMSAELVDDVVDTNFKAPFHCACEVARRLIDADMRGNIVNISSVGAYHYAEHSAATLYSAAKAGVLRLTETLAMEWARHGINVNAIAPGFFRSEMTADYFERKGDVVLKGTPRQRLGEPAQLDSTLLYLVSPASEFVTGVCIRVDDAQMPR